MASDIDRNIFFVPLDERKKQLEADSLGASRPRSCACCPTACKIVVAERTPVAFVEVNSHIALIDAHGVIMDMPAEAQAQLIRFP